MERERLIAAWTYALLLGSLCSATMANPQLLQR
jgi:hypothetical protein